MTKQEILNKAKEIVQGVKPEYDYFSIREENHILNDKYKEDFILYCSRPDISSNDKPFIIEGNSFKECLFLLECRMNGGKE